MPKTEDLADEVERLRQTTRDLVAMSTLPAIWGNLDAAGVVASLSGVLLNTRNLDLVYIRLSNRGEHGMVDALRIKQAPIAEPFLAAARGAIDAMLAGTDGELPATMQDPCGEGSLRIHCVRFGIADDIGLMVAGSRRTDFPSDDDRLLLGVAANQGAVVMQRQRAEQALKQSEQRFLQMANLAPAMLWVTEADGACTFLSSGWYEFTGQRVDEGLGLGWTMAIHPEDREAASSAFLAANRSQAGFSLEHRLQHVDGSYRWVIDTGRPRFSADGRFVGFVGSVLDITDRKQSEAQHQVLFDEITKSHKNLSEFLAVLAHELRNPLAPILTGLELMRIRAASPETVNQAREVIERQTRQLTHLIDDLLDIARVTNGKVDIRKATVDLRSVAANAVETSVPLIEKGHHAFSLKFHDAPLPAAVDATRIAQVIGNLLTNAAKYTPHGGMINLAVERDGDDAVISVTDNGIGIPPESLEAVFDMFSQVGRNMPHAQGGLGIGLSLVRQLVGLHGGQVSARSEGVGKGSTFVVRLPLDLSSAQAGTPTELPDAEGGAGKRLRILVTDDNVDAAQTLASLLELYGHEIRIAHEGVQALRIAAQFRPDVAFLDIGMPGMSGFELARSLRQIDGLAPLRIAAISGWGAQEDLVRATEAGFDRHFTKPVAPSRLKEFLHTLS